MHATPYLRSNDMNKPCVLYYLKKNMSAIKVINLYTSVYLNKDLCEPAVEPVVQFHLSSNSLVLKEKEKKQNNFPSAVL